MTSIIVLFILTVLKSNIVSITAYPSNVHEMMTRKQISQTFGTNDGSVPHYQVLSMVLPGARRRRQTDDEIHTAVKINDEEINFTFKRTTGYLATRYTPVWLAVSDEEAYNEIRYDPLPNAMKDVGEFKIYQDVENEAAIVLYDDIKHGTVMEGFLPSHYIMRSLPKGLMDEVSEVADNNFDRTPLRHKRSIESDTDDVTSYYVLYEAPPSDKNVKQAVYRHVEKLQHNSTRRRRSIPEVVYPEILLVLDHNAIKDRSITEALRFSLAFWNTVDMAYALLDEPRVHLNIAGIIISANDSATPYIARDTSIVRGHARSMVLGLGRYFGTERDRFPVGQYDMIFAMTSILLCKEDPAICDLVPGASTSRTACIPESRNKIKMNGVGVVYYDWMFGGVNTAIYESAHLLGVGYDEGERDDTDCHVSDGYLMARFNKFSQQSFEWSPCSKRRFRKYFSLRESGCLDNTPMWMKPVKEVLPGRWLTLDGQCRNSGYHKSCEIPDTPVCMFKGCRDRFSSECKLSEHIPLAGTKCGENKYCELGPGCVDE